MVAERFDSAPSSSSNTHPMKSRIVFSRTRKVRRSFTMDDKIIRQYMEVYGLSIKEARQKYRLFILGLQLNKSNLYA